MIHALHPPRRRPTALLAGCGLALALATAGCSSSSSATSTTVGVNSLPAATQTTPSTLQTAPASSSTTTASTATTATTATTAKPGPAAVSIEATVVGKKVTVAQSRFAVPLNSPVTITVTADSAQEVHLHGYDIKANASPGTPAVITFTAKAPGVFEVELEKTSTKLFDLAVS